MTRIFCMRRLYKYAFNLTFSICILLGAASLHQAQTPAPCSLDVNVPGSEGYWITFDWNGGSRDVYFMAYHGCTSFTVSFAENWAQTSQPILVEPNPTFWQKWKITINVSAYPPNPTGVPRSNALTLVGSNSAGQTQTLTYYARQATCEAREFTQTPNNYVFDINGGTRDFIFYTMSHYEWVHPFPRLPAGCPLTVGPATSSQPWIQFGQPVELGVQTPPDGSPYYKVMKWRVPITVLPNSTGLQRNIWIAAKSAHSHNVSRRIDQSPSVGYDFSVSKIEPVQVVYYPENQSVKLARNKPTTFRVTTRVENVQAMRNDTTIQQIKLRLTFDGQSRDYTISKNDFDNNGNYRKVFDDFVVRPQASNGTIQLVDAVLTLTGGGEMNPNNNFLSTTTQTLQTKPLKIMYVTIEDCGLPTGICYDAPTSINETVNVSNELIKATFPIDPDTLTHTLVRNGIGFGSDDNSRSTINEIFYSLHSNGMRTDLQKLNQLAINNNVDRVVAIVSPSYFNYHKSSSQRNTLYGIRLTTFERAVIVTNASSFYNAGRIHRVNLDGNVTAHELLHTYGISVEENLGAYVTRKGESFGRAASGYWVTNPDVSKRDREFKYCVMGRPKSGDSWIDFEHYNDLFERFLP